MFSPNIISKIQDSFLYKPLKMGRAREQNKPDFSRPMDLPPTQIFIGDTKEANTCPQANLVACILGRGHNEDG